MPEAQGKKVSQSGGGRKKVSQSGGVRKKGGEKLERCSPLQGAQVGGRGEECVKGDAVDMPTLANLNGGAPPPSKTQHWQQINFALKGSSSLACLAWHVLAWHGTSQHWFSSKLCSTLVTQL
eukprot:265268-Chlamydomonas_euryale.AAC.3